MAQSEKARRRRKAVRKPYRQGDLDGLCGVYSVINAVRYLCPELDAESAELLFGQLMYRMLTTARDPGNAVVWGIGRLMVMRLVREAALMMMDDFDITLKARWLPKRYRNGVARDQLWQALEKHMSGAAVAIVGIAGKHSHWTVVSKVSPTSMRLFDSGQLKALPRSRCTVRPTVKRHQIFGMYVVVIERCE